jgi:hypothetical protein
MTDRFKVLVSRDNTESVVIPVMAASKNEAEDIATSRATENQINWLFEIDEGNSGGGLYVGDKEECIESISDVEYRKLLTVTEIRAADKPFKASLYMEAYACSDEGEGPRFARWQFDHRMLARLLKLQQLCEQYGLSECREVASPDWENGKALRLRGNELVVAGDAFWFTAYCKHSDMTVETRLMLIATLIERCGLDRGVENADATIYYGSDVRAIEELCKEYDWGG